MKAAPAKVPAKDRGTTAKASESLSAVSSMGSTLLTPGACACGGACPRCRGAPRTRTVLAISQRGDRHERDADHVAARAMRKPAAQSGGAPRPRSVGPHDDVARHVAGLREGSRPLDAGIRGFFEPRFDRDLGHVRVREDPAAAEAFHAEAFTVGRDIVFGAGRYAPHTQAGRQLLAHELAHVLQQPDSPRVLRQDHHGPARAVPEGYLDRLLIAVNASGPDIVNGLFWGMFALLVIMGITAVAAAVFPEVAAAVGAWIASYTIAGVSIGAWLAALGISYAASELFDAYIELDAVLRQPHPTRAQIETAGHVWGERTGEAIAMFIPVFMGAASRLLYQAERGLAEALFGSRVAATVGSTPPSAAATGLVEAETAVAHPPSVPEPVPVPEPVVEPPPPTHAGAGAPPVAPATPPAAVPVATPGSPEDISFASISEALGLGGEANAASGSSVSDAVADARAAGFIDAEGNPIGSVHLAVEPHGSAPEVRSALGLTGADAESAHIAATSGVRDVPGYSRSRALTTLLPPETHAAFDRGWQRWAMDMRRAGRTDVSVREFYNAMLDSIQNIPNVTQEFRNTLSWRLEQELLVDLGLSLDSRLTLPYPNIHP